MSVWKCRNPIIMSPLTCLTLMSKIPIQVKFMLITVSGALSPWNLTVLETNPRSLLWFSWEMEPIPMTGLENLNGIECLSRTTWDKADLPTSSYRGRVSEARCKNQQTRNQHFITIDYLSPPTHTCPHFRGYLDL